MSERRDSEHEQQLLRLAIVLLLLTYIASVRYVAGASTARLEGALFTMLGCLGVTLGLLAWLLVDPSVNVTRRIVASMQDNAALLSCLYFGDEYLSIAYVFLLWTTLGHGFRYGPRFLLTSQLAGVLGWIAVWASSAFWRQHAFLSFAMLFGLIVIPLYALKLVKLIYSEKAKAEREREQALHDPLTGLPSRALFIEQLQNAMRASRRTQTYIACLFIDLDDFKAVNDTHGHLAGDALLVEVSRKLRSCVRDADLVCRLGGDEFVVVTECSRVPDDATLLSERVLTAVSGIGHVHGCDLTVGASIGVAWYRGEKGRGDPDPEALVQQADDAMYAAKQSGKNRFQLSAPSKLGDSLATSN